MYGMADIAVDKRISMEDKNLGFDFSNITDLVKTALPATLNIFANQMKLNQVKAASNPYMLPVQGLPASQMYGIMPTVGQPGYAGYTGYPVVPSSGISTTTMLAIGGAVVVGLLAFKMMK
jgi:hypothetical protein